MDLVLAFDPLTLGADLVIEGGRLKTDGGLTTSVLISIFTDRRAEADDPLDPLADDGDRRGWPGDLLEEPGERWGSRLWLLRRAKLTEETRLLVEQYVAESLAWAIDKGVADRVEVAATIVPPQTIAFAVALWRGPRPLSRWDFVWAAQGAPQ
ncbi:MAG: phage GP46 family protein [Reyranella sp.]|nr:phage GP46 family protein [Reyranella sp.]